MSMPDHIKQQSVQEFFAERSHSPGKRQNWILLFYQSWRISKHIENISHTLNRTAWHTVLDCCTMCAAEQPREQPQIDERGSNSVAVNQFLTFSLLGAVFFHVLNIHYLNQLTSFHLILF